MKSTSTLPEGYGEFYKVDIKNDKRLSLYINLIAIVIAVLMIVPAAFVVPLSSFFSYDIGESQLSYLIKLGVLFLSSFVYIILHELVHGIAMRLCGTKKVKYGFTGIYAFAGSSDYYGKGAYIFIALAPVVLWGVILGLLCFVVPADWFWAVYFIQIFNITGAAGDYYVSFRFIGFPSDILIRDEGVSMTVYKKN